jgi:hypothetical protein
LRRLDLGDNFVLDDGAVELAACPAAARLESLSMRRCGLGPLGVEALASSPNLGGLEALDLGMSTLGAGASALGRSPLLGRLRSLGLGGTLLDDDEAARIAGVPAARLVQLDLENNKLTSGGAAHVARWGMRSLRSLNLEGTRFGREGLEALGAALPTVALIRTDGTLPVEKHFPGLRRVVRPNPRHAPGRLSNSDTLS